MKKFITVIAAAVMALTSAIGSAFSVSAEDLSDVTIDVSSAKPAVVDAGNRQQSVKISFDQFDTTRLTDQSEIIVDFRIDEKGNDDADSNPVELVVQSWEGAKTPKSDSQGNIWQIVKASSCTDSQAVFKYSDMVDAYGSSDFNLMSAIYVEAGSSSTITATGMKATNCLAKGTHKEDATNPSKSGGNMLFIIIGIVSGVVGCIAVVFLILSKKSDKAFDVATGEYISKKKVKK